MAFPPFSSEPYVFGKKVNGFTFFLYCYFLVDFFLHLSARIPGYGAIRPTLLLVLFLTVLLVFQRDKLKGWTSDPVIKAIFAFIIYLAFSLPFVEWAGSVIRNNLSDFVKAIAFLFFTVLIVDTEKRLKVFLIVFVGCQLIRVFEPLFLHLTEGYWGSRTHLGHGEFSQRLSGAPSDVINPNELGFVIVTVIPFLHYLLWHARLKAKLIYLTVMPALLYALILTQSRGAMLALLVVGWMVFKASKHKVGFLALAVAIAMAGWGVMTGEQKDRYLSLIGMSESANTATAEGRLLGMVSEFKLGLNRPVVGHGLGTTAEAKANILGERQAAHNFYAELLIETGILGLVFFLRFLIKVYKKLRENGRLLNEALEDGLVAFYRRLNQSLVAVFWMYVVYSSNYWGLSQYYWYLFAGLTMVFSRRLAENIAIKTSQSPVDLNKPVAGRYGRLKYGRVHRKREFQ